MQKTLKSISSILQKCYKLTGCNMKIISHILVNYVTTEVLQELQNFRKGRNRDFLINILKTFLIKKGTVVSGTGEDIPVKQYCKILIKSVNNRINNGITKGLSKKIINKLLLNSIRESIGDIER